MQAMRYLAITSACVLLWLSVPGRAAAQEAGTPPPEVTAVITGPEDVAIGRTIVLDASSSQGLGEKTSYRWYREGVAQPISWSVESVFTPEVPGETTMRLLVRTTIDGKEVEAEAFRQIIAYRRKIVLVADAGIPPEKLALHREAAEQAGVYLRVLQPEEAAIPLTVEESLVSLLSQQSAAFAGAEAMVRWTEGIHGLQALMRAAEADPEKWQGLRSQTIVLVTDRGLPTLGRTARGPFLVLRPDQIVVTRKEAINPLIAAKNIEGFLASLEERDVDTLVVDEATVAFRPWNALTWLVTYMLTHGVPSQTVILLLSLPVIATILAFLKQVVGVTTFGLFTPSIVALSFLALGWWMGILFLLSIVATGYITREGMRRWRLLHVPKMAIILTVISLTLLLLLSLGALLGMTPSRDTVFILLIMSTLTESLLTVKAEEGWRSAFFGIGETILAALLCVFIVQWSALQSLLLAYPELVLLTLVVNVGLGKWTGLRLVEYFRFREVFRHLQEE